MDSFKGMIIKTYEPWYRTLSNGTNVKFSITPGWEYMINVEYKYERDYFNYTIFNIDNGHNNPKEREEEIIKHIEKVLTKYKKPVQMTIFDFL